MVNAMVEPTIQKSSQTTLRVTETEEREENLEQLNLKRDTLPETTLHGCLETKTS